MRSVYLCLSGRSLSWGRAVVTSIHAGVVRADQAAAHRTFRQQAEQGFTYLSLNGQYGHPLPDLLWEPITAELFDVDWPKDSYPRDPGSGVKLPVSWVPHLRINTPLRDPSSTTLKLLLIGTHEAHL